MRQVARKYRNGEIRATAFPVRRIHLPIRALGVMRARGGDQMPAGGEPDDSNLVWVDLPLGGVVAD